MKNESRYFIALIPPEPYYEEVTNLKGYFRDYYNSKAALRSPPHITLHMPFRYADDKERRIFKTLADFAAHCEPLKITQEGFGAFEPRVIFINVLLTEELKILQHELLKCTKQHLSLDGENYKGRAFHPHMTIAFRDLKKPRFYEAWEDFADQELKMEWLATELVLLKHDGAIWRPHESFSLRK